jgi:hypothetical protein
MELNKIAEIYEKTFGKGLWEHTVDMKLIYQREKSFFDPWGIPDTKYCEATQQIRKRPSETLRQG